MGYGGGVGRQERGQADSKHLCLIHRQIPPEENGTVSRADATANLFLHSLFPCATAS